MDVNAVQQGAGDPLLVAADHRVGAGALPDRVTEVAAGAGILTKQRSHLALC